jgi:hypothetical protein
MLSLLSLKLIFSGSFRHSSMDRPIAHAKQRTEKDIEQPRAPRRAYPALTRLFSAKPRSDTQFEVVTDVRSPRGRQNRGRPWSKSSGCSGPSAAWQIGDFRLEAQASVFGGGVSGANLSSESRARIARGGGCA